MQRATIEYLACCVGARIVTSALKSFSKGFACPAGQATEPSLPPGIVNPGTISRAPFARIADDDDEGTGGTSDNGDAVAAAASPTALEKSIRSRAFATCAGGTPSRDGPLSTGALLFKRLFIEFAPNIICGLGYFSNNLIL